MRFSLYQSSINNFCCVAPVKAVAYKMKQTRCDGQVGAGRAKGTSTRGWILWIDYRFWKSPRKGAGISRPELCRWDGYVWIAGCDPHRCSREARLSPADIVCWLLLGWFRQVESLCSKGKNVTGFSEGCIYSQGISRKMGFLNWGGGRGRREGLDRDELL